MKSSNVKTALSIFGLLLFLQMSPLNVIGQEEQEEMTHEAEETPLTLISLHDGTEFVGEVLKMDARELLIKTTEGETFFIPRHEIRSIENIESDAMVNGELIGEDRFATRYFYSTNGLPIKKGEHYALLNYYGPEIHFAASNNLSLGVMTTWIGAPIVGTAKLSIPVSDQVSLGVGALAGGMSWLSMDALGALGFGTVTLGNRRNNLSLSGGYAVIGQGGETGGSAPLMAIAGMTKVSRRASLVFDSFIFLGQEPFAILMPGVRITDRRQRGAFQFGFGSLVLEGGSVPIPIPMVSYFINLN